MSSSSPVSAKSQRWIPATSRSPVNDGVVIARTTTSSALVPGMPATLPIITGFAGSDTSTIFTPRPLHGSPHVPTYAWSSCTQTSPLMSVPPRAVCPTIEKPSRTAWVGGGRGRGGSPRAGALGQLLHRSLERRAVAQDVPRSGTHGGGRRQQGRHDGERRGDGHDRRDRIARSHPGPLPSTDMRAGRAKHLGYHPSSRPWEARSLRDLRVSFPPSRPV